MAELRGITGAVAAATSVAASAAATAEASVAAGVAVAASVGVALGGGDTVEGSRVVAVRHGDLGGIGLLCVAIAGIATIPPR